MIHGQLLENEPMAHYTSFHVGGPARVYIPHDLQDLLQFLPQIPSIEPIYFLGLGSNTLVRDGGLKGTVIITKNNLKQIDLLDSNTVRVEVGVPCPMFARYCARNHLEGTEFLIGIPGTIGGALTMNAGCHGGETWNFVEAVETIDRQGVQRIRYPDDYQIAYRHVIGPKN